MDMHIRFSDIYINVSLYYCIYFTALITLANCMCVGGGSNAVVVLAP